MSDYLIKRRAMMLGIKEPDPKKPKKPIPSKSAKRKEQDKQYRKIVREMIDKDGRCQVQSPKCTGKAQGLNHKQKRSPNNLLQKDNLTPCCNACNLYIELNSEWAKKHGHFVSRFVKK